MMQPTDSERVAALQRAAAICHLAWCSYQRGCGQPFNEVPEYWQLASIRAGIEGILANPDMTPEQSHEQWMAHKLADGWIYGPTKDVALKEHPDLVPFAELDQTERGKDDNFQQAARFALRLTGLL